MAKPRPDQDFKVDADLIRQLAKLLEETGLTEIEVEQGGHRIRVARGGLAQIVSAPVSASTAPVTPVSAASPVAPVDASQHPGLVTSPMVGTAYLSPEPKAA